METEPPESERDEFEEEMMLYDSGIARWVLLVAGTISVILGVIGLLLPLVPTTPFLLLAAGCYARSSKRFYVWLMTNRWFGKYIRDWRAGKGIPLRGKIGMTVVLAVTFGTSIAFFVPIDWVKVLLVAIATSVAVYIWRLPTRPRDAQS